VLLGHYKCTHVTAIDIKTWPFSISTSPLGWATVTARLTGRQVIVKALAEDIYVWEREGMDWTAAINAPNDDMGRVMTCGD
jgi:hypothetical protein